MRFVVTGSPGSGTRYMARLFTAAGAQCGHERALPAPTKEGTFRLHPSDGIGESSWAAAPWLTLFNMPTIHVVRDPIKVISKLWNMKFTMGANREAVEALVPGLNLWTGPNREAVFWLRWTGMADLAETTWQVENIPVEAMRIVLKRAQIPPEEQAPHSALADLPTNIGSTDHDDPVGYRDLSQSVADAVAKKASLYGYHVPF